MDNITRSHIEQIQQASKQNRLVIFVGAGVSSNSGVPLWSDLIKSLKTSLPDHVNEDTDSLKIAQLYKELRGEKEYLEKIKEILKFGKVSPNEIHKAIYELNPCHIVTTNYDDLLEQSALAFNQQFYVVRKDDDIPCNRGEKMIIKMHGDFGVGNIVLTENDYFDYSRQFPLIRSFVLSLFASKLVLFVGFSFNDINLKYILRNVSNILKDKMQKSYLLVDYTPDSLTDEYYKKKGVCLVNLNEDSSSNSDKGKVLLQQLKTIRLYDPYEGDIIGLAISFLEEYGDQIAYLGKYIKYIIPKNKRQGLYLSMGHLHLPDTYSKHFKKVVQSEELKEVIKKKYGDKLYDLIAFLLDNQVEEIENFSLKTENYFQEYKKRRPSFAADHYYDLDLVQIGEYIKELRNKSLTYTKEDLQLPFILYRIGDYSEACRIFKDLAPKFWEKRKYYLYFICLYNYYSLSRLQRSNSISNDELQKILNELPLEENLKSILNDIFSFKVVNDTLAEVYKLQSEIEKQRKSAEKGGWSLNSNIGKLLYSFRQSFDFCNENCIVNDFFLESQDIYKIIAEGILDSIMTPDFGEFGQTKLNMLYKDNILLFVFQLNPEALSKVLSSHVDKPIPANDDFKDELKKIVANLASSLEVVNYTQHIILPRQTVSNYIKNIILICNFIENPPILDRIYELIIDTWSDGRFFIWMDYLIPFLNISKPSSDNAIKMLDCVIGSQIHDADKTSQYVAKLADIIGNDGKICQNIVSIEQIKHRNFVFYTASFIKAVNESLSSTIIQYVQDNADCLYDLVMSEFYTGVRFLSNEKIIELSDIIFNQKCQYTNSEEITCAYLLNIFRKKRNDVAKSLLVLAEKNDCFRFFMNPLQYISSSEIKISWLRMCNDDEIKELLKDEQIRNNAKKYIEEESWDKFFKDKFMKLV